MNMQMCSNGHFYDADVYAECPSCRKKENDIPKEAEFPKTGEVMNSLFPKTGEVVAEEFPKTGEVVAEEFPKTGEVVAEEFPKTGEVMAAEDFPKTSPAAAADYPKTAPVAAEFPKTAPVASAYPKTAPVKAAEFPRTAPVGGYKEKPSSYGWNPILGWLVCIQGNKRGKDFRLTQEHSYLGRAVSNDVALDFDDSISRDTNIVISYKKDLRVFILNVRQSRNKVSVNGEEITSEFCLRNGDEIEIGTTVLKLVSFCNNSFSWEE